MAQTFTCAACGNEFESNWSEESARAEYEARFGEPFNPKEVAQVCDTCYAAMGFKRVVQ